MSKTSKRKNDPIPGLKKILTPLWSILPPAKRGSGLMKYHIKIYNFTVKTLLNTPDGKETLKGEALATSYDAVRLKIEGVILHTIASVTEKMRATVEIKFKKRARSGAEVSDPKAKNPRTGDNPSLRAKIMTMLVNASWITTEDLEKKVVPFLIANSDGSENKEALDSGNANKDDSAWFELFDLLEQYGPPGMLENTLGKPQTLEERTQKIVKAFMTPYCDKIKGYFLDLEERRQCMRQWGRAIQQSAGLVSKLPDHTQTQELLKFMRDVHGLQRLVGGMLMLYHNHKTAEQFFPNNTDQRSIFNKKPEGSASGPAHGPVPSAAASS